MEPVAFLTLAQEATIIAAADADADAVVTVIGQSVDARDISAVAWGPNKSSGQADIVIVGCQHGVEPSGREAILNRIDDWVTSLPGFLSTLTVVLIPTANPDGFDASTRENTNAVDLNRNWLALTEPETQAIADVLAARTPLVVLDLHETVSEGSTFDVLFSAGSSDGMRNGHPDLHTMSLSLRDALIAAAEGRGDDSGIWGAGDDEEEVTSFRSWRNLDVRAQMTHGAGVLAEVRRGPSGTPVPEATRIALAENAFDDAIAWLQSGTVLADLAAAQAASRADQAAWGRTRRPGELRNGTWVEPAPAYYQLTASQETTFADWLTWFDITIGADDRISLAQASRAAILALVDPRSGDGIVAGALVGAADLELDYTATGELGPPLDPTPDDAEVANLVTASRRDGGAATAEWDTGTLSTADPPDGVGVYDRDVAVNAFSDGVLADVAGWALHVGTWDEERYPVIRANIRGLSRAAAGLVDDALVTDLGARVVISNPPVWLPPEDVDQVVLGYTESISVDEWLVDLHTTATGPYHVATVEGGALAIVGSDSATLAEDLDTTETGVDITCGAGPDWVYEVDYDIMVGGERMTVTPVGAASGTFPARTQTLTVTRSVNGIVKAHSTGAAVAMYPRVFMGL